VPDPAAPVTDVVLAADRDRVAGQLLDVLFKGDRGAISIAAISAAAADAVGTGWKRVDAAAEPRDHALLELAAKLCHTADE
jgi:hypothetical protein